MSNFSKRKHLVNQVLGQEIEELKEKQSIVKVIRSKGNNLHEVESSNGETFLMSMPTRFRKVAYVKVGDYVLVESIDEGDKVRAEMVNIILSDHIPIYIDKGIWPEHFKGALKSNKHEKQDKNNSDSDSDDELFRNVNKPPIEFYNEDSDGEDSDDEDSDDEDNDDENSDEKYSSANET